MMKSSSKVSQLIKDDIQSKIIQIYKSVLFIIQEKLTNLLKTLIKMLS